MGLVIARRVGQWFFVDGGIGLEVVETTRERVRLNVHAADDVPIWRAELGRTMVSLWCRDAAELFALNSCLAACHDQKFAEVEASGVWPLEVEIATTPTIAYRLRDRLLPPFMRDAVCVRLEVEAAVAAKGAVAS